MVSHGVQSETVSLYDEAGPASDEANGATAEEGGEEAAQVSNNDIRNMLLPFIRKPAPAVEESADDGGRKRRKKKRKGADDDSSDDEREPPPPISLDKLGPVRAHALHTCTCSAQLHGAHGMRTCMARRHGGPRMLCACTAHALHMHTMTCSTARRAGHGRPVGRTRAAQVQGAGEVGVQQEVRAEDQVLVLMASRTTAPRAGTVAWRPPTPTHPCGGYMVPQGPQGVLPAW